MKFLNNKYLKIVQALILLQEALSKESAENKVMITTYWRATKKKATKEEMDIANDQFRQLLKTLGMGAFVFMPFSIITLPLAVKVAKLFNIDLIPRSFKKKD